MPKNLYFVMVIVFTLAIKNTVEPNTIITIYKTIFISDEHRNYGFTRTF